MVPDILELSLGECSAGAFFQKLAELLGGTLVVVESPCGGLGFHVQVTMDSVDHFVKSCSVEMFCGCSDEVEVEVEGELARKELDEFARTSMGLEKS